MLAFKVLKLTAYATILLSPVTSSNAQSSYDPPTNLSFTEAVKELSTVSAYRFGTQAGNNITNLSQLSSIFNPYGRAKTTVVNQEWERYQPFNTTNFVFTPTSLNLTATIPEGGGLFDGGINSGQIWSKKTYEPGVGNTVYAATIRMKVPNGVGMWPGFWFDPVAGGDLSEIDIAEFSIMKWQNQYDWTGNNHGPGVGSDFYSILSNPWTWHPGIDFSAGFHNYQVIWTADATYKYVDDQLILAQHFTWTSPVGGQLGTNLAVGSSASKLPGLIPDSLSEFPSSVQVESITVLGGPTANPQPSQVTTAATYQGLDTKTAGTWTGKYGANGYAIANDASKIPSFATLSIGNDSTYTWAEPTSDSRALQTYAGSATRIASTYAGSNFTFHVNFTDGKAHTVALYLLNFDDGQRAETISVLDAKTGTLLSRESFADLTSGEYATWSLTGDVVIEVVETSADHAVVSAIFFD